MAVFPVVADANELYGILQTDFLITTAGRKLYRLHWSERILEEAERNLQADRPEIADKITTRFGLMRQAMPEAMVEPADASLVDAMTNHPGDRHVLATAVSIGAEIIVTENSKHFDTPALRPHGIETRTLDEFAIDLVSLSADEVWATIVEIAGRRRNPPTTPTEVCNELERYMPEAIASLRAYDRFWG